jgi:DNA gyrase subunit A
MPDDETPSLFDAPPPEDQPTDLGDDGDLDGADDIPDGTDDEAGGDEAGGDEASDNEAAALHFPWDGEQVDYSDAMLGRGRAYGSYVITSRAIPDVRDGLKPVQRRIIVAMDDLGLRSDRRYSKSARTVGAVIGIYHPHGDSAVYDAMVRMAQPWQSNLPLIDGQGNWGNLNNEAPAAANRYTESRLSPPASAFLSDLRPEIVDYEWNFDETTRMPSVLPVTFPNLLVNGSMGVAWAMACSIPPHNAAEAIDAALLILDKPDVSLDRILEVMPGPDLPGGGIIVNPENLRAIYETGRGTVLVQGRVEQLPGQAVLRITELPYQVSAKSIVEQAVAGAKEGKITEIYTAELPKNLTDAAGVDVRIRSKRGGSIVKLTEELLRHTKLRDTLAFNCTVLVDGTPQTLPLLDMLRHFVDFRRQVVTKRLVHERNVLLARLHLLLAERAAADVIDRVVQIIRHADDDDDSKRKLIAELRYLPHGAAETQPIDDVQAQHIIDMALKKINTLNQLKIDEEITAKSARVDEINATLDSPGGVSGIVRAELRDTRKRFGQPRRTVIPQSALADGGDAAAGSDGMLPLNGNGNGNGTSAGGSRRPAVPVYAAGLGGTGLTPAEDVWVYVASNGATLLTPAGARRPSSSPLRIPEQASLVAVAAARSDQSVLAFTEQGLMFRAALTGQVVSRSGAGRPLVDPGRRDRLVSAFAGPDAPFYLVVTAGGQIKRMAAATIGQATETGTICCRVPAGDRVVAVVPHGDDDEILLAKAGGQVLRIETGARLRPVATAAAGTVAGIKVDDGDRVVTATRVAPGSADALLSVHETGMALAVALEEYPVKGRGTGGVASVATDRPSRSPAGPLALLALATAGVELTVFTDRGGLFIIDPADIPILRRATTSRPLLTLGSGEIPRGQVQTLAPAT